MARIARADARRIEPQKPSTGGTRNAKCLSNIADWKKLIETDKPDERVGRLKLATQTADSQQAQQQFF
jgi:hypothetical protein